MNVLEISPQCHLDLRSMYIGSIAFLSRILMGAIGAPCCVEESSQISQCLQFWVKKRYRMKICDALFMLQVMDSGAQLDEGRPQGLHLLFHQPTSKVFKLFSLFLHFSVPAFPHLLPRLRISDNHINGLALSPSSQGSKHLFYR